LLLKKFVPPERLKAAHLDHALRDSSSLEADRAVKVAEEMGLRCQIGRVEVKQLAQERKKGLEEAARAARYDFLLNELIKWPGDFILTAHQAEDQAETLVMKLARGAGPGALVGIRPKSGQIIRPLLAFGRQELVRYLNDNNIAYTVDPSNLDERFRRNLVRKKMLPILEQLNPAYLSAFGRAAGLALAEEEFWEQHLDLLLQRLEFKSDRDFFAVKAKDLADLTLAEQRRVLGRLLRLVKLNRAGGGEPVSLASVEMMLDFFKAPGAGGLDLPGGRRVELRGQYVYVGPASRYATKCSA
jgi:tRNA(Ile)-lysidine synthase